MGLIVVANRGPIRQTDEGWQPAIGGLATALLPVLERQGGVWVAMREADDLPEQQDHPETEPRLKVRRVPLSDEEREHYYDGMANRVLWPLSHYLIHHLDLDHRFHDAYRTVNARFAEATVDAYHDGDVVWVQDYHLMLVPQAIRRARPDARIGFFWHIPWPAMEVFRVVPGARELVRGLLGADLIGFHVEEYVENFVESARVLLGAEVRGDEILWEGRAIRVEAHPIGIDVERFEAMAGSAEARERAETLRAEVGAEFLVAGVDRLDYTKGIPERLLAFEELLREHPHLHERVTLYQVATPSRTDVESYQQLKREVDEAVGRINGAFMHDRWVPVRYHYQTFSPEELAILYRAADVMLVTPLRDGMNLVTHEFVAASERGVLVLSEMTGAAYLMPEAVQVNPYDRHALAESIRTAIEMDPQERRSRLARLKRTVAHHDVHRWASGFLDALQRPDPS